ncbi:type I-E CRISPR-associated protein Cse2/CasB [Streptomyces sp. CC224B]|uniref:type I-E CRISPR-associated protein Cse2/CasB n=1 Tax=Streptomyces sp. CC224B TaxID=3044571 RepID=UPI0024A8AD61|nr:type I-E CRISPR-associated protein Cse2/CasB [Streptomyces sp. CC224B]
MTSASTGTTRSLVAQATTEIIGRLQAGYRSNVASAVASVARLRREAGRDPHSTPTAWGLDDLEALTRLRARATQHQEGDMSEALSYRDVLRHEQQEEREDRAVHLAVTLWALHQQSIREEAMHVDRWTLGRAVRRLAEGRTGPQDRATDGDSGQADASEGTASPKAVPDTDLNPGVRKRFVRIGSSADFETLGVRLREMVLLLRAARIPLDYGSLADQLDRWQQLAFQADVRREWGRGFHRAYASSASNERDGETPSGSPPDDLDTRSADTGD